MFWNYLKLAYRNLLRHPLYAAINVVGLGIAIAFCVLAFLYVRHEWTYDAFHENADRIYRVYTESDRRGRSPNAPAALAPALAEALPDVRVIRIDRKYRFIQHLRYEDSGTRCIRCRSRHIRRCSPFRF